MVSFCHWKRNFLKDRVCNNKDEITLWLESHNIMKIPIYRYKIFSVDM